MLEKHAAVRHPVQAQFHTSIKGSAVDGFCRNESGCRVEFVADGPVAGAPDILGEDVESCRAGTRVQVYVAPEAFERRRGYALMDAGVDGLGQGIEIGGRLEPAAENGGHFVEQELQFGFLVSHCV